MSDDAFRISGQQLVDRASSRNIVTCSLSADIGLGGGLPQGTTVLLGGKFKSGKTTLSLQYGANAQNQFGTKIYFFNIEARLSKLVLSQIRGIKLDKDHFEIVMPPATYDKEGNVVCHKKVGAEWWWKEIGRVISEHPNSTIIIDSINALSSEKEVSEGIGWQGRGDLQKLEAQFCRSYGDLIVPNGITLFLLTQIQANTSGYGETMMMKCGNAIKHLSDAIIFARGTQKWKEQNGKILGHDILCRIDCSPLGPPFIETTIPLRYGYGIDDLQDVITHAINWDIIKKAGAWYTLPFLENDGKIENVDLDSVAEDIKPLKFQGEDKIRNWLLLHPTESALLEKTVRSKILG
jgi:recombination protein RecA